MPGLPVSFEGRGFLEEVCVKAWGDQDTTGFLLETLLATWGDAGDGRWLPVACYHLLSP